MSLRMTHLALAVAMAAFAAAPLAAQDRATTVEFKTATRLPGVTLQPGTYVFRLGQPATKQNVVEVYSSDGSKKIATLLTVDYAVPPSGDVATVVFEKTNRLAPEGPVGTSGKVTLEAATTASLIRIRAHLKAFHAQAMK